MIDRTKFINILKDYLKFKTVKITIIILGGVILFIAGVECWLNYRVRASLRDSLGWGVNSQVKLKADLNWLNLYDLAHGQVRWVRVEGENCLFSNLRFSKLQIDNEGFSFNLPLLLREHRIVLLRINKTRINAKVTEGAFSDYFRLFYPQFQPSVKICPSELVLFGEASLFNNRVPIELAGNLKVIVPKSLRFYPNRLLISGRSVPKDFLRLIGNQLPLSLSLFKDWPLQISTVRFNDGYLWLSCREM